MYTRLVNNRMRTNKLSIPQSIVILMMTLFMVGVLCAQITFAAEYVKTKPNFNYQLHDVKGNVVSTANSGKKAKILIFGRVTCGNTKYTLSSISDSDWITRDDIEVMFVEEGKTNAEGMEDFISSYCCDEMTICATSGGYGADIMWDYNYYMGGSGSVTYPVILIIDENDNIRCMTTGAQDATHILRKCVEYCGIDAEGTSLETINFKVKANCGQEEARSMLDEMNARRTGSNGDAPWCWNEDNTEKLYEEYSGRTPLIYDYNLEKVAMQRAAELSVLYGHERPDGTSVQTAFEEFGITESFYGENIAAGYGTAEEALDAWWEEDEEYSGQGHRRNILQAGFNYVGIGHVTVDGVHFWVQEFSKTGGSDVTPADDSQKNFDITCTKSDIAYDDMYSSVDNIRIAVGESAELPEFSEYVIHKRSAFFDNGAEVVNGNKWRVKDASVASISGNKIVGKQVGTTKLVCDAVCGGNPLEVPVEVFDSSIAPDDSQDSESPTNPDVDQSSDNDDSQDSESPTNPDADQSSDNDDSQDSGTPGNHGGDDSAAKVPLRIKSLWASQHSVGEVLFKWTQKEGTVMDEDDMWVLKYRMRKIGGNAKWSEWYYEEVPEYFMGAWIEVDTDYVIEIHAQATGDTTWSTGIITCPAGGRYQAMKTAHVINTKTGKRLAERSVSGSAIAHTSINLKVGQTLSVKPDYEYPVKNIKKRPRLYPSHMLYDIGDKSMITITKPDGSKYTGGIIDGTAAIKATKAGKTTITFRSPNGRTMIADVTITN